MIGSVPRLLVIGAFRYALGRMSYIVSETTEWMESNINNMSIPDRRLFIKEIEEAEKRGGLGMSCDEYRWLDLKQKLMDSIDE
jgi:hypothetical protein